jgi:hypothetical protein
MATGENNTTWGDVTNLNLGTALEEAIVGSADVTFASADVTLTLTDTNASQTARNMRLRCTGTTGGSTRNLIVPSIEKPYIVRNDCADSVVVKTAAGTGITVPAGKTMWVYSDATNVVDAVTHLSSLTLSTPLPVSSGGTGVNTSLTAGSVVFAGASGAYSQDNANFFWDDTNNRLGIGTASPLSALDVIGNIRIPSTNSLYWAGASELINAVENNRMTFFVASSERMRIDSSGNLGVGTTSPQSRLNVNGGSLAAADSSGILAAGSLSTGRLVSGGGATLNAIHTYYDDRAYEISAGSTSGYVSGVVIGGRGYSGTGGDAVTLWTRNAERMRIIGTGDVGVGTSAPTYKLHIAASGTNALGVYRDLDVTSVGAAGQLIELGARDGSTFTPGAMISGVLENPATTGYISFATRSSSTLTERMRITSAGDVGIGTTSPAAKLDVNGNIYGASVTATGALAAFAAGGGVTSFYSGAVGTIRAFANGSGGASVLAFNASGSENMRIDSSGNVGIGTSSPNSKLDVSGEIITANGGNVSDAGGSLYFKTGSNSSYGAMSQIKGLLYNAPASEQQGGIGFLTRPVGAAGQSLSERMRIDASGNVGVGTNATSGRFSVKSAPGSAGFNAGTSSSPERGNLWYDTDNSGWVFNIGKLVGSTFTPQMTFQDDGKVGIGTSSPANNLQVSAAVANTPTTLNVTHGASGNFFDYAAIGVTAVGGLNGGMTAWGTGSGRAGTFAVGSSTNHPVTFMANDTEHMRITALGSILMGMTTAVDGRVTIAADTGNSGAISTANNGLASYYPMLNYHGGTLRSYMAQTASGFTLISTGVMSLVSTAEMAFNTNGAERMRIDTSGNVGIGTSSPGYKLVVSAASNTNPIAVISGSTKGLRLGADTNGGIIEGVDNTGVGSFQAMTIGGADIRFTTSATERARIDSSGNLLVGTTSQLASEKLAVVGSFGAYFKATGGAGNEPLNLWNDATSGTIYQISFRDGASAISRGSITTNGTNTAFNTSSDYRLKEIDGPIANSGAYIDALKPVQGSWKADGSRFIGLLAHEVQEVSETPIATGEKDGEEMQGMDYSAPELIANLIAEIQSLRARVAQLEGN